VRWCGEDAYVTQARVLPLTRPVIDGLGSVRHIESGKLPVPSLGGVSCCRSLRPFHHPAYRTIPCAPLLLITPVQKKNRICITTRVIPPLAAAPATERSERVGEEAEESQRQALCTYAPVPVSACVLFIGRAVFTHLCGFLLLTWCTSHPLCTDAK
jgi:hypothetical protein